VKYDKISILVCRIYFVHKYFARSKVKNYGIYCSFSILDILLWKLAEKEVNECFRAEHGEYYIENQFYSACRK
jgi:hypothetical protein